MKEIREILEKINHMKDCYIPYFNVEISEEGIPDEGYHLSLIRKLLDTISNVYDIKMNPGAVLNLSLAILNFTRTKNINLHFDPYKCEISGSEIENDSSRIIIFNNSGKLHFHMSSVYKAETYPFYCTILDGYLTENDIIGESAKDYHEGTFTINFTEDGLLQEKKYKQNINISPNNEWPTNEINFRSKTTFENNISKTYEVYFVGNETFRYIDEEVDIKDKPTNKIVGYIPIFMEGYYNLNNKFCIPTINPDSIEYAFPEIYNKACNQDKTRTRNNR